MEHKTGGGISDRLLLATVTLVVVNLLQLAISVALVIRH
jgi:hypothetical protein